MSDKKMSAEEGYKNLVFIWIALLVSQILFLVIVLISMPELAKFDLAKPLLGKNEPIIIIFAIVAIINIAISFVLRNFFLKKSVDEQNISFVQTAVIGGSALCETSSVFGMMLAFVADYQYFFLWIALGASAMLFHFPKRDYFISASYKK